MNWKKEGDELVLNVPIKMYFGTGNYSIHCVKRPPYCDRGDWLIHVRGTNDVDYQDGFPRYFFGTEEEVKKQMETWLNKRTAYQEYEQENDPPDHSSVRAD